MVILAGHTRYKALKKLRRKECEILVQSGLTEEQKRKYRLLDNKTNEFALWDDELLSEELDGLDFEGFNFGFDFGDEEEETEIVEDEAPEVDEDAEPIAKLGDIWQLGRHRLMCGDSTDKATVELLMDGKKADMVFTDPPYGIDYSGGRTQVVNTKDYGKLKKADMFEGEILKFLYLLFEMLGIDDNPTFTRSMIINELEETQKVLSAAQYLDDETILRKLRWITPDEVDAILENKANQDIARFTAPEDENVVG